VRSSCIKCFNSFKYHPLHLLLQSLWPGQAGIRPANATSTIPISGSQTDENIFALPSSHTSTDSDIVSDDVPIALRKEKHTYTSHLISRFVSYSQLSPSFHAFISSIDSYYVPKSVSEALSIPR